MDVGALNARINLNTAGFTRGLNRVVSGLGNLGGKIVVLNQALDLGARAFTALDAAARRSFGTFIQAAATSEKYRLTLDTLLRSTEEGARMFDEMTGFAAKVPFEYEKIMGSAKALSGVMKGGVDEVKQWMPLVTDLAAVSGLTIEETTGQIIRMYSAGAASADLFRERGITAMLGFTAGVSYTAEETRKRLMEAFEDPLSMFRGASQKLAKTWEGILSMLADQWFLFRNQVMDSGLFDAMKNKLQGVLDQLLRFKKDGTLDQWAKNTAKSLRSIVNGLLAMVRYTLMAWGNLRLFGQSMLDLAFATEGLYWQVETAIRRMFGALFTWVSNQVNKIVVFIREKLEGLMDAVGDDNWFTKKLSGMLSGVDAALERAGQNLQDNNQWWEQIIQEGNDNIALALGAREQLFRESSDALALAMGDSPIFKLLEPLDKLDFSQAGKAGGPAGPKISLNTVVDENQLQKDIDKLKAGAEKAREELSGTLGDLRFEQSIQGLSELDQALKANQRSTQELKDRFREFFAVDPGLEEMIDNLHRLREEEIRNQDAARGMAESVQSLGSNIKEFSGAVTGPLADALAEFAKTGKFNWDELRKAMGEQIRIQAAYKTANLLMEAAYQGIMYLVYLAMDQHDKAAKALTAAQAAGSGAAIMGSFVAGMAGMAHDGITTVPREGTWLLDKGERVVDSETNEDLKNYLKNGGGPSVVIDKIEINGGDEEGVKKALPQLKQTIIEAVTEDISTGGQVNKSIQTYVPR